MDEVTEQVRSGSELVTHAHTALESIIVSSEKVLDRIRHVAAAGEEHAATSAQISETIESISAVTRSTAAGTTSIVEAAEHLTQLVELTHTHVARFRVGDDPGSRLGKVAPQPDELEDRIPVARRAAAVGAS